MSATKERRTRTDRRVVDMGPPPGWSERRKTAERRLPTAEEAALSADDFARYFGSAQLQPNNNDYQLDLAAEVLDRVRDNF